MAVSIVDPADVSGLEESLQEAGKLTGKCLELARVIAQVEDLRRYRLKDIASAEIQWNVEGVVPCSTVVMVTGEAGAGKSTFISALGYSVSRGLPFLGRKTTKRPVLFLDAENPSVAVCERFARLGIDQHEDFMIWGQWCPEEPASPGDPIYMKWIASCESKPLIIVDSLIRFHSGAENDASETQRHMALYRKMAAAGATVIILHHVGRDIDQDYRGSSDIKASVDVAYKLTKTDRKPQLGTLQLRAFKQRISVTPVIYLKYQDGQFSVDVDDCPPADSAVSFVELLKANPGITQNAFESLPTVKKLGRNRARAFLAGGTESGVRIERRGKANIHFWCDPNARGSDRAQDSIAAARAPRVDGE